jgi:hypothetical protein
MAELRALQAQRKESRRAKWKRKPGCSSNSPNTNTVTSTPPLTCRSNPRPLGFVFSKPAIQRQIERDNRLGRAGRFDFRGYFRPSEPEEEDAGL